VNRHRRVKVAFCGAHRHCNSHDLYQFRRHPVR
jgi:hypothetical protein